MSEYVIEEKEAREIYNQMEEEFGELSEASRMVVLDAIRRGCIQYDAESGKVTYTLQKPIDLKNGSKFTFVKLEEPTAGTLEDISKGVDVKIDGQNSTGTVSLGYQVRKTIRLISIIGGVELGIVQRMKRRDFGVLDALSGFFD